MEQPGERVLPSPAARQLADRLIADGNAAEDAGDLRAACSIYREAVAADPGYAKAHLNLGIALAAAGDATGAMASYARALEIEPRHPFVNYNIALAVQAQGDMPRVVELLRVALAAKPDFFEARVVLANAYEALGNLADATVCLRAALELRPDHPGALNNLGTILHAQGKLDEAQASCTRAASLDPDYADAHFNLGTILQAQRRLPEAAASLRRALSLNSNLVDAHFRLGNIHQTQGDLVEAARCFRAAIALRPDHAEAHNNLGTVCQAQGYLGEAFACYRKATSLRPDFAEAHCNLGCAFQGQQKFDEAIACYRAAIAVKPNFAEALYNLGSALHNEEALPWYEKALAQKPDYAMARWGIALSQQVPAGMATGDPAISAATLSTALTDLDRWFDDTRIARGYEAVGSLPPFFVAYQERNNRDVLAQYGKLCARLMKHWQHAEGLVPRARVPETIIRVGIVSAHIHDHSVWNAIVRGWFRHVDPSRFSLYAFHLDGMRDQETQFARSRAVQFRQERQGLRAWVETILADQLDILIYPEIGMHPTTIQLASLRLAPVQIASWGHPETTGLPTIDYYLSAEDLEPADARDNYTEELVLLPRLGCCYEPLSAVPVAPDLAALGIHANRPIFICAGTPYKYVSRHDRVFTEIARRVGPCQFVFSLHNQEALAHALKTRLAAEFAAAGMDFRDYGVFLPWQSRPSFYGLLQRADVYLDTIGFSGFNTAMQAIECGLPIVTREGRYLRGRLASGILKRMGLSDLVVATEEDYVELAVTLASDGPARSKVRERMEAARSILFDDVAPIRALEDFLAAAVTGQAGGPNRSQGA